DFIGKWPIVVELHRAAGMQHVFRRRTNDRRRRGDILDALDAALNGAVHLKLNPLLDRGLSFLSSRAHEAPPVCEAGRFVRGGRGAPPSVVATSACTRCNKDIMSFRRPSI